MACCLPVTNKYDLVRLAGFLFLGSIPKSDFISFHPIVFRGFQVWRFFKNTSIYIYAFTDHESTII